MGVVGIEYCGFKLFERFYVVCGCCRYVDVGVMGIVVFIDLLGIML